MPQVTFCPTATDTNAPVGCSASSYHPQHAIVWSVRTPQEWLNPAAIAMNFGFVDVTVVGKDHAGDARRRVNAATSRSIWRRRMLPSIIGVFGYGTAPPGHVRKRRFCELREPQPSRSTRANHARHEFRHEPRGQECIGGRSRRSAGSGMLWRALRRQLGLRSVLGESIPALS